MNSDVFSDPKIVQEFFQRFDELSEQRQHSLEVATDISQEAKIATQAYRSYRLTVDEARTAVASMQEGRIGPIDAELEAIILRFCRPAYFIKNDSFTTDSSPSTSVEVNNRLDSAKKILEPRIPSVGRINVRNHIKPWEGTGWIVAPGVIVTNRHVAGGFAQRVGDEFLFTETGGKRAKPELDLKSEYGSDDEIVFKMKKVLWIEPPTSAHDVAFLSIEPKSLEDDPLPTPIDLMDRKRFENIQIHDWCAVIGYPALSPYNNAQDQQRIFQGVFDVKRLQPGLVTAKSLDGTVRHDATTLGGNSGSVLLDMDSGSAIALHWGGLQGEYNSAVAAPIVRKILQEKVLGLPF